jgi:hypothetical protein
MRVISKIFSITLVLYILSILFASSIKAQCACKSQCGPNEELDDLCTDPYKPYYCCRPTSTPQPTNIPAPLPTSGTSATGNPPTPTTGGMQCSTTAQCYNAYCAPSLTPIPNCSSVCINGHCYTTNPTSNPTITNVPCQNPNDYGPWSGCLSGQGACGGCAAWGYTCQVRHCIHPPTSNQYQISCGCGQPAGGGNPTNTPAPTAIPTPNPYWLKLKDISFRGLSSIPWSSALSHSLCVFVPSW